VHAAVNRLQGFIRQVTANGQRRAWYLQLDIRNYFMRIDKAILWRLLEPHIADADARWLTELLVFHDCTEGHIFKGRPGELELVPPHTTLLRCEPGKGLPIGNLNSQFFANVYLNGLDQLVKHGLKCRHYIRTATTSCCCQRTATSWSPGVWCQEGDGAQCSKRQVNPSWVKCTSVVSTSLSACRRIASMEMQSVKL